MLQQGGIPVSTSAGYDIPSVNVAPLGCPLGLARKRYNDYNPSFPTFNNQILEGETGNLAKLSSSIRNRGLRLESSVLHHVGELVRPTFSD